MHRNLHFLTLVVLLLFSSSLKAQDGNTNSTTKDSIVDNPDQMPEYPGGYEAMEKFIGKNVKYPHEAMKKNVEGTVYYKFLVLPDGKIADIKIIKDIGAGCGEAGLEAIEKMPLWHPGLLKGKPVPVQVSIPIKFVLK